MDDNGHLLDLKILGLGIENDIGAAIAIEIEGEVYAPLHDFQGNIIALINKDREIVATYDYDAFGRVDEEEFFSPWGFSSKRKEEGLICFGNRFYIPLYGRWLTPDPLGFLESTNPYLFVLNSPLNRLDLFGLYSIGIYFETRDVCSGEHFSLSLKDFNKPIYCTAILSKTPFADPVDCIVISGFVHQIHFTPMEKIFNKTNLLDHFSELVPKQNEIIGLVTAENGIYTSLGNLSDTSMMITSNIPERTTFIALHNKSEGLIKDGKRVRREMKSREMTRNAIQTGLFLQVLADSLNKMESNSLWLHVPHSEAGLLFNLGQTMLSNKQKEILQNQMYVIGLAPPEPISHFDCKYAINIYSEKDRITGPFGKKYKDNPAYDIRFVKCRSSWSEYSGGFADHAALGTTYRNVVSDRLDISRGQYGFYDCRKR
jgi:RHS repeat-associated protein